MNNKETEETEESKQTDFIYDWDQLSLGPVWYCPVREAFHEFSMDWLRAHFLPREAWSEGRLPQALMLEIELRIRGNLLNQTQHYPTTGWFVETVRLNQDETQVRVCDGPQPLLSDQKEAKRLNLELTNWMRTNRAFEDCFERLILLTRMAWRKQPVPTPESDSEIKTDEVLNEQSSVRTEHAVVRALWWLDAKHAQSTLSQRPSLADAIAEWHAARKVALCPEPVPE